MKAEILMIGTELLIGQIVDTNAAWLGQTLAEHGIHLYQKTTVGDNRARIVAALCGALERSDVVLCSGGLGPTEDDITRECVAEVFGVPLVYREDLFAAVLERFKHVRIAVTENNKKQAWLPEGAEPIDNPRGTAPGLVMKGPQGVVICMPGVPHELKGMVRDTVIPYLRAEFGMSGVLHYRALKVCGIGESRIDDRMGDLINALSNPTVGLLANPEATRIRIAAHADTREQAEAMIAAVEAQVRERLPGLIFGADADTIESVVAALLTAQGWRIALLETTTGGMITQRLLSANPDCVAGAEILPGPPPCPEGLSPEEAALDLAKGKVVGSPSLCALAAVADPARRRTVAAFVSPEAEAQWEIGEFASGQRNQLRAAIYSLERIRRALLGIQAED